MKLNLGCGTDIRQGYKNYDYFEIKGADGKLDITKRLPFNNDSVEEILCIDTFEHMRKSLLDILAEFYRVLQNHGVAIIQVPFHKHPAAYAADHVRYFTIYSFDGVLAPEGGIYSHMFKGMHFKHSWETSSRTLNNVKKIKFFGKDIGRGIIQYIYLPYLSWFFPFKTITFRLVAIKPKKQKSTNID